MRWVGPVARTLPNRVDHNDGDDHAAEEQRLRDVPSGTRPRPGGTESAAANPHGTGDRGPQRAAAEAVGPLKIVVSPVRVRVSPSAAKAQQRTGLLAPSGRH